MINTIKKIIKNNFIKPKAYKISEIKTYLDNESFSESLVFDISTEENIVKREEEIINQVKNKKVIHVGCVDHLEIIDEKIKNKTWLHKKIIDNTMKNVGLDINEKGIGYLKNNLHYNDVYYCDLTKPDIKMLTEEKWDFIILGEILEHVDNPQEFLKKIFDIYKNNVSKILITVPNGFNYYNFRNTKNNYEIINSDHRTTFSPYTLIKIMSVSGFRVEKIIFADPTHKIWHKLINGIIRKNIFRNKTSLSNTLMITAYF